MGLVLAKEPAPPEFTAAQVEVLTEVVFLPERAPSPCDAIFVFAGTHPGHWCKAAEAWQRGFGPRVIVTGGRNPRGGAHASWDHGDTAEADVIARHLGAVGVPDSALTIERQSTNTLENVLEACRVFPFSSIRSLLFVCKSHAAGRQYLTLARHLPAGLDYVPFTFDADYGGVAVGRRTWAETDAGRRRVWGEYLRILLYSRRGDIATPSRTVAGLEGHVASLLDSAG